MKGSTSYPYHAVLYSVHYITLCMHALLFFYRGAVFFPCLHITAITKCSNLTLIG